MGSTNQSVGFFSFQALFIQLILLILGIIFGSIILLYTFVAIFGLNLIFISFIMHRNQIVIGATEKIINQYPDLIKGLVLKEQK